MSVTDIRTTPLRIYLTGATGFIGTHVAPRLIEAGHTVVGSTRSDAGADALRFAGVEPFHATLEDAQALAKGAEDADAVIHCAFDHDFSNFVANCQKDQAALKAFGEVLKGSDRPLLFTSGVGTGSPGPGRLAVESILDLQNPSPRTGSEILASQLVDDGVRVITMRLPQVHDTLKQGLISPLILLARAKGCSAYIEDGAMRFSAAHVSDVAVLYRLAVEQGQAGERFNAVDEEGVSSAEIAAAVGQGLGVPVVSLTQAEAAEHFGFMGMFAALDLPASSAWTRERLGWTPTGPGLLEDLRAMDYGALPS